MSPTFALATLRQVPQIPKCSEDKQTLLPLIHKKNTDIICMLLTCWHLLSVLVSKLRVLSFALVR